MFSYSSRSAADQNGTVASRIIFITALLGAATAVSAQNPRTPTVRPAQTCGESETIGWLGISGLNCTNCVFTAPGRGEPILFGTEPRITSVAPGSPAAEVIRSGDVLVSVDGAFITTHAGGTRFHNLKPGDDVTVVIRRNGDTESYRLDDLPPICRTDHRVPGWHIPHGEYVSGSRVAQTYGGPTVAPAIPRSPLPQGTPPAATTVPRAPGPPPDARAGALMRTRAQSVPRASFGFSISCGRCVSLVDPENGNAIWEFDEPPQIYSVDANSEAYRAGIRRGDVITRIDGRSITTPEGGRRFGAVMPGQRVEFTIRRGSQTLSRAVRAEPTRGASVAMTARERETSLEQARRLTEELLRHERVQSAQLDQMRRNEDEQIRTLAEQLRRQQTEQNAQLSRLQTELARADRELSAAVGATRPAPGRATMRSNTVVTVPGDRTMRYVGRIGDIDIEVRGGSQIRVAENQSEYIITIGDSEIRLKKNNPPR
jgi:hypothetical protein